MSPVATPHRPAECDNEVVEVTADEWRQTIRQALGELGLTWEQLKEQAERRDFSSRKAHVLWITAGEVLD